MSDRSARTNPCYTKMNINTFIISDSIIDFYIGFFVLNLDSCIEVHTISAGLKGVTCNSCWMSSLLFIACLILINHNEKTR